MDVQNKWDIRTKPPTDDYRNNYDAVFRKRKEVEEWPEERIDVIGQNGNSGEHYHQEGWDG